MSDPVSIETLADALIGELIAGGKSVSTAESCTGGWIAKSLTDIAGSSACFCYGIVSYSNGAKESLLGVRPEILAEHGAVSEETVREMAQGVLGLSGSDLAVAVSGIAGPDGGTDEKPVGTVWLCWASRNGSDVELQTERKVFPGDREAVRVGAVSRALQGLREALRSDG